MFKHFRKGINKMPDNKELFMREYLCKWPEPSEGYQEAYKLWIKYRYKCERFDQFVCKGNLDEYGFVKPIDTHERILINRNSSNLIKDLYYNAKIFGISNEDLKHAKRDASRLTCKGLEEEYRRLFDE